MLQECGRFRDEPASFAPGKERRSVVESCNTRDIIGRPGRRHALRWIEELRSRDKVDFVVVNGENAAGGIGLTPNVAKEILERVLM